MTNLRVIANMFTPMVFIDNPNLDAVLLYEYCRQNDPKFYTRNINAGDDFEYPEDFPLKKIEFGNTWFYACSNALYKIDKTKRSYWNRRADDRMLEKRLDSNKKIRTGSGSMKNYRIPMNTNLVKTFTWYCVGDKKQIKDLLSNIKYLGKKRSQGKGQIKNWLVSEIENDCSIFENGKLIKTVPIEYLGDNIVNENVMYNNCSFKPPYWLYPPHPKADIRLCATPILSKQNDNEFNSFIASSEDFDIENMQKASEINKKW